MTNSKSAKKSSKPRFEHRTALALTSHKIIKPENGQSVPVLEYKITAENALPGKECGAAILAQTKTGLAWSALPSYFPVHGHEVTITQYTVPTGLYLVPQTSLYFAINCF